jgi:hypothetical protein
MAKQKVARRSSDLLKNLRSDEMLQKRLAKFMALHCFRNTALEDLHAGTFPSTASGDYSDVNVISPFGDIPWPRLSRFDDAEMRELMIDVVSRCYAFVKVLVDKEKSHHLLEALKDYDVSPEWNEPAVPGTENDLS